jgi:hypothetical protein
LVALAAGAQTMNEARRAALGVRDAFVWAKDQAPRMDQVVQGLNQAMATAYEVVPNVAFLTGPEAALGVTLVAFAGAQYIANSRAVSQARVEENNIASANDDFEELLNIDAGASVDACSEPAEDQQLNDDADEQYLSEVEEEFSDYADDGTTTTSRDDQHAVRWDDGEQQEADIVLHEASEPSNEAAEVIDLTDDSPLREGDTDPTTAAMPIDLTDEDTQAARGLQALASPGSPARNSHPKVSPSATVVTTEKKRATAKSSKCRAGKKSRGLHDEDLHSGDVDEELLCSACGQDLEFRRQDVCPRADCQVAQTLCM